MGRYSVCSGVTLNAIGFAADLNFGDSHRIHNEGRSHTLLVAALRDAVADSWTDHYLHFAELRIAVEERSQIEVDF